MTPFSFNIRIENERPIFILGAGRSGTTLVQRIINTAPRTLVWGEHGGFLKGVAESYHHLSPDKRTYRHLFKYRTPPTRYQEAVQRMKDVTYWQAWENWFHPQDIRRNYQQFVRSFFYRSWIYPRWGFKEILYGPDDSVTPFLYELFPRASFVFVARDPHAVITSQRAQFERQDWSTQFHAQVWQRQYDAFLSFACHHPQNCLFLWYEDLIQRPEITLAHLFRFLQLKQPRQARAALATPLNQTTQHPHLTQEEQATITSETSETVHHINEFMNRSG